MPLKIYNSLTRKKEDFVPLNPPEVKMYVCGPTVYDEPHIGHLRSAYVFEMIRNYLSYSNYQVHFVRNVTDVDDKIIEKARGEKYADLKEGAAQVSQKYENLYDEALGRFGLRRPDAEPHATENIPDMINLIQRLIDKGYAYQASKTADVYFNVRKFSNYGRLSNQKIEEMLAENTPTPSSEKRDPHDFALWKSAKPDEPSWESPWGKGRPGWHIECSAMSMSFLRTTTLDIHGGGQDLIFPHHENEVAQSEAVTEKLFSKYWIHHGLVTAQGQKMSKSLKNYMTLNEACKLAGTFGEDVLKIAFLTTHYSQPVDINDEILAQSRAIYSRFRNLFDAAWQIAQADESLPDKVDLRNFQGLFCAAMDDNFNVPQAIKIMNELAEWAWKSNKEASLVSSAKQIREWFDKIFGVYREYDVHKQIEQNYKPEEKLDFEADFQARKIARGKQNFELADKIRKKWEARGFEFLDFPKGTIWRRKI